MCVGIDTLELGAGAADIGYVVLWIRFSTWVPWNLSGAKCPPRSFDTH